MKLEKCCYINYRKVITVRYKIGKLTVTSISSGGWEMKRNISKPSENLKKVVLLKYLHDSNYAQK